MKRDNTWLTIWNPRNFKCNFPLQEYIINNFENTQSVVHFFHQCYETMHHLLLASKEECTNFGNEFRSKNTEDVKVMSQ